MIPHEAVLEPSTRTPESRLHETTAHLMRGWMRLAREDARDLGLTVQQLLLLGGLIQMGVIPATRWAELVGASPSTATGLLDGLESAGLVRRVHATEDRRQVLVVLTAKGQRIAERLARDRRQKWRGYCHGIPANDLDSTSTTLAKILERIDEEAERRRHGDRAAGGRRP